MTTIHLSDSERDQFAATGHIVVDGESCPTCGGKSGEWEKDGPHDRWESCPDCDENTTHLDGHAVRTWVLPAKWRPATEPCDCVKAGTDTTWMRCTKCLDGIHRVVTLTATCPGCYVGCQQWRNGHKRELGHFTIRLLPVIGSFDLTERGPWPCVWIDPPGEALILPGPAYDDSTPLAIDPLPQPGQWVLRPEAVPT